MRSMSVYIRLFCIRHGETIANKEHRMQGHLDIPLNFDGEIQSKKAGMILQDIKFDRAYSSDLKRARATCEIIIQQNAYEAINIIEDSRIKERNFGTIDGKLYAEVQAEIEEKGVPWDVFNPEGGETLGDVQERVVKFLKEMCQSIYDKAKARSELVANDIQNVKEIEASETILLVSHGLALKMLYFYLKKNLNGNNFPDSKTMNKLMANTSISEFILKFSPPRNFHVECLKMGDASHLN